MGYIAFASAKGSPGVTTAVAALAATWPVDRALLVAEVDPAGGDLVVRLDLAVEPGLVTLAAAGRRELGPGTLLAHTQALPVPGGGDGSSRRVLVAPVAAEQATASLAALRGGLVRALDEIDADVLVDCGRLDPASPAYDVATGADLLVAMARPVVAEVHHLSARLASVAARAVSLLMVGDSPYSAAEVAESVGTSALGALPADHRAARVLAGGNPDGLRALRRSRLLRDARSVAEVLAGWLGPGTPGSPGGPVAPHRQAHGQLHPQPPPPPPPGAAPAPRRSVPPHSQQHLPPPPPGGSPARGATGAPGQAPPFDLGDDDTLVDPAVPLPLRPSASGRRRERGGASPKHFPRGEVDLEAEEPWR